MKVRNYRLYFLGQALSQSGTWMQTVAQSWLVLRLTGSGADLGLVLAAQFLPVLIFGPAGGALVDRLDKRRVLFVTQGSAGIFATTLGILDITGSVRLWMVFVLAAGIGGINIADSPARQSFVTEMVGPEFMPNAVMLNTILINAARIVGPALAAACIALVGTGWCFLINGMSFGGVIVALAFMRTADLFPLARRGRERAAVRQGLRYVAGDPVLRTTLIMLAIVGMLASEFPVSLPLIANRTFAGSSSLYALFTAAMGMGAVLGGLTVAGRGVGSPRGLSWWCGAYALTLAAASVAPSVPLEVVALVATGVTSVIFTSKANSTLQLNSAPEFRGRVMSLWAVALLGTTPIGGPLVGAIADLLGSRFGLGIGAVGAAGATLVGFLGSRPTRNGLLSSLSEVTAVEPVIVDASTAGLAP
jgi:MFS family permease